jgi:tetratricopeptide (TPR) repeat protein
VNPSLSQNSVPVSAEESALRASIARSSENPEAHLALAVWLRGRSRSKEAAHSYQAALMLRPEDPVIALKLAATLLESNDLINAESLLQKLTALSPPPAGVFFEMGKLRFLQGRREEAVALLQRALQNEPGNAECCAFLGHVYSVLGNKDQAMALFQRAAQLDPAAAEPWRQMALLVQEQTERPDRFTRAEEYLKKACERAPDKPVFHCAYGDLLFKRGRLTEAVARFKRAREADPGFPLAIAGTITALEHLGDLKGAAEFARDALDRYPSHPRIIQAYAPVARHIGEEERAANLLEGLLARPDIVKDVRVETHFALGKLYDRLKRYPEAFRNFEQANAVSGYRFNREEETLRFERVLQAFPSSLQSQRPRASNRSRLPVFIVGMPRSGTTLTEQILASHPLVYGAGELEDIANLSTGMQQRLGLAQPYPYCMAAITRRQLDTLAQAHLDRLGSMARDMARVTDKMPHNFVALGLIDLLFPGARVIHCRRDPLDNCVAIFTQHFSEVHGYAATLSDLGYYYKLYERLMRHWAETIRIPVLELRYEDMVAEPERHIRELIAFCDLPWDERCLRFHETKREVNTMSYDQVRRPIYKTSAGRWRNYAPSLGPLFDALGIANPDAGTAPNAGHG